MADTNSSATSWNPAAGAFSPVNGTQVSSISSLALQFKVEDLEREQACSRAEVSNLKTLFHTLRTEMDTLKKDGGNITVGPFRDQSDSRLAKALDAVEERANGGAVLLQDALSGCCTNANVSEQKPHGKTVPPHLPSQNGSSTTRSIPPHLRGKNGSGVTTLAPHKRHGGANGSVSFQQVDRSGIDKNSVSGKSPEIKAGVSLANNPLVTDGNVDTPETDLVFQKASVAPHLTPPLSPKTTETQVSSAFEQLSIADGPWKPQPIADLPKLPSTITAKIPSPENTISFSGDFLRNHLCGSVWSPGLIFVPPPQTSILPDRVYYTVDPTHDPHLPSAAGQHGAKLVPFFNVNPEDSLDFNLPEDFDSTSNVPMFVLRAVPGPGGKTRKRYVYYGHYTQSRWSDKLDYDRMVQCVPASVREYWAEELSASGRPEWVTEELKKHFFPAPAYRGALPAVAEDEGGSVAEEELAAHEEKVVRDVKRYVEALRVWKKDSDMKTNLIKKDFILTAFEQVSSAGEVLGGSVLTRCRLMRMNPRRCASGGSTSSAWTGALTSTIRSSRCRAAIPTTLEVAALFCGQTCCHRSQPNALVTIQDVEFFLAAT